MDQCRDLYGHECYIANHLYEVHGHRITEWNNQVLALAALEACADAIYRKGAALDL